MDLIWVPGAWELPAAVRRALASDRYSAVVAVGAVVRGETPHFDIVAGEAARGATAYVTLEPCAHTGRTGPCADALVEAGISCVLAAMRDPFPKVDGAGFARLRDAGIACTVLDAHISAVEGGIGAFPRRLAVSREDAAAARRVLRDAGEAPAG